MSETQVELNTFGAIIRFAIELETTITGFYKQIEDVQTTELFRTLGNLHKRRIAILEEILREKLNELILEPISGLNIDKYSIEMVELSVMDNSQISQIKEFAISIEKKSENFYLDSAKLAKSFSAEVTRIFERFGRENKLNVEKLKS